MKLVARAFTITAAAVMLTGLAMAQDETGLAPYIPAPPVYDTYPMPTEIPPAPPEIKFPTSISIGTVQVAPTFPPPGIRVTIPF